MKRTRLGESPPLLSQHEEQVLEEQKAYYRYHYANVMTEEEITTQSLKDVLAARSTGLTEEQERQHEEYDFQAQAQQRSATLLEAPVCPCANTAETCVRCRAIIAARDQDK